MKHFWLTEKVRQTPKKIKLEKRDSFDGISRWCHNGIGWAQEKEFALELLYKCAKNKGKKRMGNDWKKYFGGAYGIGRGEKGDKLGDCHGCLLHKLHGWRWRCMVSEGSYCALAWE